MALQQVLASGKRKIGFLGLSFKTGTDDLRESPLVMLAEQLIGKGCQLSIYDPEVHLSQLLGANRRYVEQHLPHIGQLVRADIAAVIAESELIVVGLSGADIAQALARHAVAGQQVLDLVRLSNVDQIAADVKGLCW